MPINRLFPAVASLLLLLAAGPALRAQDTPVLSTPIPDLQLAGSGTGTVDLTQFFAAPGLAGGTLVQMQTVLGNFNIRLVSNDTPKTVQNFLNYTNRGAFDNTIIHRSVPNFVIQGGGFTSSDAPVSITTDPAVVNEFKFLNTRGTIAMARPGGQPNGATSQWFINLVDNNSLSFPPNGEPGYTVFGRVTGTGMTVVDAIAALPLVDLSAYNTAFSELPVRNLTGNNVSAANLVTVNRVINVPVFPTQPGQTAVVSFTGTLTPSNIITASFEGSTLVLNAIPGADGITSITVNAVDTNGNQAADTFSLVSTHIVAAGSGTQVNFNTVHPNGNVFDQVLLTGTTATVTADSGQVTRLSFVDLNDDIVQLEFSGAGTLKVTLENATGPAAPLKYNQAVNYMKGHAVIEITGANETTNLGITSVGKLTAFDPTGAWDLTKPVSDTNNPLNNGNAIFKAGESYDGIADVALVTIASTNGKFGGVRCAGAGFFRSSGRTGLDAPGVEFTSRVLIHDLNASGSATPVLLTGAVGTAEAAGSDFRGKINVAGGDLDQPNGQAVQIGGAEKIKSRANTNSHYVAQAAQTLKAQFSRDGANVTAQVVENP